MLACMIWKASQLLIMRDCFIIKALKPERWKERGCKACLTRVPSLSLLFPERERKKKGREYERIRRQRQIEERAESKTITLWVLSPIKEEKKNHNLLALLGGPRRADALQWSMDLTVEDITMSLIETFLQGLLWGSSFVEKKNTLKHMAHPHSGLLFQDVVVMGGVGWLSHVLLVYWGMLTLL